MSDGTPALAPRPPPPPPPPTNARTRLRFKCTTKLSGRDQSAALLLFATLVKKIVFKFVENDDAAFEQVVFVRS